MSALQHLTSDAAPQTILDILERDGCVVLDHFFGDPELTVLRAELEPHLRKTPKCHGDFFGHETKRVSGLIAKSTVAQGLAIDPVLLDVMTRLLGPACDAVQLNLTQAISIGPGEPAQIIHTDDAMFPYVAPGIEAMVNCMFAVDAFTAENGATLVVPGSHRWPRDRRPEPHEILAAEMAEGSVLLYRGSLLHGGGANTSTAPRTGLVLSYCLGWLRQAENQYLAVPRSVARTLPEPLQRLIGYYVHKPNLGCVEGRDPIRTLRGESLTGQPFEEFLPDEVKPLLAEHRRRQTDAA